MKNSILLTAVVIINSSFIFSQPCLPEGITFTTQEEIDNFQTNYPGCTEIEGDVYIQGSDISNLLGLSVLHQIEGDLEIFQTNALIDLSGIDNLVSISGNLIIQQNLGLTSLTGLNNLQSIDGALNLYHNLLLTNLLGLNNLNSIGSSLNISSHTNLTLLSGLNNLTTIGGNCILNSNYELNNLLGLNNLNTIAGFHLIKDNDNLINLNGLQNLDSIGGFLEIENNDELQNLTGLNNLNSIAGDLIIEHNESLGSLGAIVNLDDSSINDLYIRYNYSLSECEAQTICSYLNNPNGTINIQYNAPGCNCPEEVIEACQTAVEEMNADNGIIILPNPSNDKITISSSAIIENTQLSIFNVSGEKVLEKQLINKEIQLDISALPRGVYFVRVQDEKIVEVGKMVKE